MFINIAIAVTFCCALLIVYPYAIYPIVLHLLPSKPVATDAAYNCQVTLVFCAFNEERSIAQKLANIEMLKKRHPQLQVLAFDDGSKDNTAELIAARPDLVTLVRGAGRNGKAYGMKILARMSQGDIIVFTDANVTLREDAIARLMQYYADPTVGGVCGSLRYYGEGQSSTAEIGSLYWKLEEHLKKEESRTGNVMGADGSIFSLRRELYPEFPDTVLDDLTVSMAAVFSGHRLIKAEDVIAFEALVAKRGEEFARKMRISTRAFHTHLVMRPQLKKMAAADKFKYASRKMIRWFGGLFLILGVFSAVLTALKIYTMLGIGIALLLVFTVMIGMKATRGPLAAAIEVAMALVATLVGVFKAMRGQTFTIWNPAKSR